MAEPETETAEKPPEKKESWIRFLLTFAIAAWILRSLIVAPFSIPSGSMLPTMWIGDYLFVQKWSYGYSRYSFPFQFPPIEGRLFGSVPDRGDIVVFRPPGHEGEDWVKRVVGLPGDRIAVSGGQVSINGVAVPRVATGEAVLPMSPNTPCRAAEGTQARIDTGAEGTSCRVPAYREQLPGGRTFTTLDIVANGPGDDFSEVTVPAGHVFLMGDNRDDSLDSRFPVALGGIGFVPVENIVGRATIRFWSTDGSASWINPISWFTALRGSRIGGSYNS